MIGMITGLWAYIEKGLIIVVLVVLVVVATALSPIAKLLLALASLMYKGVKKLVKKNSKPANDTFRKKKRNGYENYLV